MRILYLNKRIQSIDILRSIVMILMVLDHIRLFWNSGTGIDPTDLNRTWPLLFFTRWITHFCAPVFVFLSGLSVRLKKEKFAKSSGEMFKVLLKRGFLLLGLEAFLISPVWGYFLFTNGILLQVIWVIGLSLILLSIFQFLPARLIGLLGFLIILSHNLIPPSSSFLMSLLFNKDVFHINSTLEIVVLYPLVPWFGVMALGYGMAEIYQWEKKTRVNTLTVTGVSFVLIFVIFRSMNLYGDPSLFIAGESTLKSLMSFLNLEKYPPSFLFLMMTLGPALLMLRLLEDVKMREYNPLLLFGRTPLFFYVFHLYLILLYTALTLFLVKIDQMPFGLNLFVTYSLWPLTLAVLYVLCRWFYKFKYN